MARIKICGITNPDDATAAVRAGADALGFVFYPRSPRYVAPKDTMEICRRIPPLVWKVGVFVNMEREMVEMIRRGCGLDALQLHGSESPEYCASFRDIRIFKAFRVRNKEDLEPVAAYQSLDAILVDGFHPEQYGGSGVQAPWSLLQGVSDRFRLVLAGGLTPENVSDAIRRTRPYAVDVSSGVEREPGKKDPGKMVAFVRAVRGTPVHTGQPEGFGCLGTDLASGSGASEGFKTCPGNETVWVSV